MNLPDQADLPRKSTMDTLQHWRHFQEEAYAISAAKGFHDNDSDPPQGDLGHLQLAQRLLLVTCEVAEAFEEIRDGADPTKVHYQYEFDGVTGAGLPWHLAYIDGQAWLTSSDGHPIKPVTDSEMHVAALAAGLKAKPLGVPIELADVIIRVADLAQAAGIDLGAAIETKMAYNRTRAHMHGKTC